MIIEAQYLSTLNVISISYTVLIVDLVNFKLWSSCRQYAGSITPVSGKSGGVFTLRAEVSLLHVC